VADRGLDAGSSLGRAAVRVPVPTKRSHESEGKGPALGRNGRQAPFERVLQIVLLGIEPIGPHERIRAAQSGLGFLRKRDVMLRVPPTDLVELPAICEGSDCHVAYQPEHRYTRLASRAFADAHQAD